MVRVHISLTGLLGRIVRARFGCSRQLCSPVRDQQRYSLPTLALGYGLTNVPRCTKTQNPKVAFSAFLHAKRTGSKIEGGTTRARTHLVNGSGITETPTFPRVRLTNFIARITTTAALGWFTAIARTTVPFRALLVQLVNVITELSDLRALDNRSCSRETGFEDVVRDVALKLPRYIHQVEG